MRQIQDKKNIIEIDETIKKNVNVKQQILGFVVYFTCFAVAIPIIFHKNGFYNFLESYLPNLDLVANILCWYSGKTDYGLIYTHLLHYRYTDSYLNPL